MIKIGAKVVSHGRYTTFQVAEVGVPQQMFQEIPLLIAGAFRARTAQPLKIDWRLTAQNGSYKINDIIIEGLSMAANGRSQLEGVVERDDGRPQAILAVMRQQIAGASAR